MFGLKPGIFLLLMEGFERNAHSLIGSSFHSQVCGQKVLPVVIIHFVDSMIDSSGHRNILVKKKLVPTLKAYLKLSCLLHNPSPSFEAPSPVYFTSEVSLLFSVLIIAIPTVELGTLGSLAWPSRLFLP